MEVNFIYGAQQIETVRCQPRDKIKDICESFFSKKDLILIRHISKLGILVRLKEFIIISLLVGSVLIIF